MVAGACRRSAGPAVVACDGLVLPALCALGVEEDMAHTSLRFGIGRFTTEEEVDFAVDLLRVHVARLREMSPLWELVQEGVDLSTINWTQDAAHSHSH